MIYITSILFTFAFIFYSKFQFEDLKHNTNRKWKVYGMAMRALFFAACYICSQFGNTWQDYLLAGAINILIWEMGINVIALNEGLFHVGTTGKIDKKLDSYKWLAMLIFLIISIILKITT